ncbi:MAG TPA: sugar transferase [Longimicrobiales bacterium]|nr:sugar transferase [Longimicrobiales bacterium]
MAVATERTAVHAPTRETASDRKLFLIVGDDKAQTSAPRFQRELNVLVAFLGLLICLPVFAILAVIVKISSPGPVFYKQQRVGVDRRGGRPGGNGRRKIDYGGKLFTIYKFRTMFTQTGNAPQVWADKADPRVTPVGRVLRKYRLDELPQLFNVLKGDMNIVGPRPEQPEIFLKLREQVERYGDRQRVLPGITGFAQINHHYDMTIDDVRTKVRFDLEYAARQSAMEDLRTMVRTVPVVLFRRGGW